MYKGELINIYKQGGQELMVTVETAEYRQEAVCWRRWMSLGKRMRWTFLYED